MLLKLLHQSHLLHPVIYGLTEGEEMCYCANAGVNLLFAHTETLSVQDKVLKLLLKHRVNKWR